MPRPSVPFVVEERGAAPTVRAVVSVAAINEALDRGCTLAQVLALHPTLTRRDVGIALVYPAPLPRLRHTAATPRHRRSP